MRDNWLPNRVFASYTDLVDHCCEAWNKLIERPWTIMSIGLRDWAMGSDQRDLVLAFLCDPNRSNFSVRVPRCCVDLRCEMRHGRGRVHPHLLSSPGPKSGPRAAFLRLADAEVGEAVSTKLVRHVDIAQVDDDGNPHEALDPPQVEG